MSSNVDERDHPFILGSTNQSLEDDLVTVMTKAEASGASGSALQTIEDDWEKKANLRLFGDGLVDALANQGADKSKQEALRKKLAHVSRKEAEKIAKSAFGLKPVPYWHWGTHRTGAGCDRDLGGT